MRRTSSTNPVGGKGLWAATGIDEPLSSQRRSWGSPRFEIMEYLDGWYAVFGRVRELGIEYLPVT